MPWEHTGSKIAARHRERLAVVYVRQSTRQQVVGHQESTRLQYALVDRAVALGWEASRVLLIDDDLGKSGSSAEHRVGFQRLVAEISLGHVGLVLGTEMSRLARSGKDWYQLLELCALGGSLLADTDGVYDPTEYNDRLLLGLKGTMSEAELYLINQRMRAGRVNKARRGELVIALPVGYWRRPLGGGGPGPRRAGAKRGPAGLCEVRGARLRPGRGAVPGGARHPTRRAGAKRPGQGRDRLEASGPGDDHRHDQQPDLCRDLRLRPPAERPHRGARRAGGRAPGGVPHAARSAWPGSRTPCPPTSRWPSTRPTWSGSRRTGRTATCPERSGSGRRCWPGCCAVAAAGAG